MSEKYTILSKEELLDGVSSVSGRPAERSSRHRSSSRSEHTSDHSSDHEHKDGHRQKHHKKHKEHHKEHKEHHECAAEAAPAAEKKPRNPKVRRIVFRAALCVVVIVGLLLGGLSVLLNQVFNGPSPAARDALTKSLLESGFTEWIPALFLGDEMVEQIKSSSSDLFEEEAPETADPVQPNGEE